jgi:hypothetical protein
VVNRCCLCKLNRESVDHLFLHCEDGSALWNAIFSCFGLSWVMPNSVAGLFACWWLGACFRSAIVWKTVPLCLLWSLWRERNDRNFNDQERTLEELKCSFFFLSLLGQLLVWRERNDRNFNDQERTLEELKSSFFFSLFTWTTACLIPLVISFYDFLVLFSLCS